MRILTDQTKTNASNQYGLPQELKTERLGSNAAELMRLNYSFDAQRGNLSSRSNTAFGWNESFSYDNLDRLTNFNDNNGNQSQTYDGQGRIASNSSLGNYAYSGNSYRQTGLNNVTSTAFNWYKTRPLQQISYNAFKSPVEIAEQGKEKVSFQYNAAEARSAMYYGDEAADKMQRRYRKFYSEDGSMEIVNDVQAGSTNFVFYLSGDAYSAPAIWKEEHSSSSVAQNLYFLYRDHLGSILMITDAQGAVKEKRQFDAWGNIVKLEDGNGNLLTAFVILDRGYTGHEHLLGVALIHMNGRLYDPMLHRFLSPDNFVQDPFNTQSYNRYGYVMNNPLIYTDPSGEFIPFIAIVIGAAILGGGANVAANWKHINGSFSRGLYYFGVGAVVGAGATVGAAAFAPVIGTGAISGAIFGASGGFVTGFANTMFSSKGNWGASFKAGGWGALIGGVTGGLAAGTFSSIRGNNFWTGAPKGVIGAGPSFRLKDAENITTKSFWRLGYNPKGVALPEELKITQYGERASENGSNIGGRPNKEWGDLFEWGKRPEGALEKLSNVSASDVLRLKDAGVSIDHIIQWRDLYQSAINKGGIINYTAKYRMSLMEELIKLW